MRGLLTIGFLVLVAMAPVVAQDRVITDLHEEKFILVLQDKVSADFTTPAAKREKKVYYREVNFAADGHYHVIVRDTNGRIRMQGTYLDHDLQIPHGTFTFYYDNGIMESKGEYARGVKTGIWERYLADGTPRAERVYAGQGWEAMEVSLGLASQARSL